MRQQDINELVSEEQQARKRINTLNRIFFINLILSVSGFWQLHTHLTLLGNSCFPRGVLLYFAIGVDCFMASTLFIFVAAKNSYNTRNYFLFVLISNIQIVCRFVYLNETLFACLDCYSEPPNECLRVNLFWEIGKTLAEIVVYYLVSKMTGLFIKDEINVRESHSLGFLHKKSRVMSRA